MTSQPLWQIIPRPRRTFFALLVIGLVFCLTWAWSIKEPLIPLPASPFSTTANGITTIPSSALKKIDTSPPPPGPPQSPHQSLADSPLVLWPLARLCDETDWVPGLNFICDENSGGPGNIRNYILTCVRYAIAGGATGLVVPRIRKRSETEISHLFGRYEPLSYLFDEAHFRRALGEACPRIRVWDSAEDIPGLPRPVQPPFPVEMVKPKALGNRTHTHWMDQNRLADAFQEQLLGWLEEMASRRRKKKKEGNGEEVHHRAVRLRWGVLFEWPVARDGPELAATFGGLLRVREDVLALGKQVAAEMRAWAKGRKGGDAGFLGIHLRSESDSLSFWPRYEEQRDGYLARAKGEVPQHKAAYLATGNATEAEKFGRDMREGAGVEVVSKHTLLAERNRPDLKEALDGMTWDQQAVVDFVVLLECDFFMGVSPSSFSVNVALKRHLKEDGLLTRPWKIGGKGDGRSWIVGNYDNYLLQWLFMYDGIWP